MATGPSGKSYIGQTVRRFGERITTHLYHAKRIRKNGLFKYTNHFARAVRKYKEKDWKWKILYNNIPTANLNLMEIWLIAKHNTFYKDIIAPMADKDLV